MMYGPLSLGEKWKIAEGRAAQLLGKGLYSVNAPAEIAKAGLLLNMETRKPTISSIIYKTTTINSERPTHLSRVGVRRNMQGRNHRLGKAQVQLYNDYFQKHIAMKGPLITRKEITLQ